MAQTNVAQFAKELGVPSALLLEQLQAAGVSRLLVDDTPLTEQDKTQLLEYLRRVHGTKESKNKITLTRRETSEIKKADSTGKARTIQVEVRKKRVLVKREATPTAPPEPPPPPSGTVDAEQTAIREEEARKQAELIARQAADAAAKVERQKKRKEQQDEAAEAAAAASATVAAKAPEAAPVEKPQASEPTAASAADTQPQTADAKASPTGTLHKPTATKAPESTDRKPAKKPAKDPNWRDESAKRRAIKTRGVDGPSAG